ncbi:hypothetical protein GGR52DRAFT_523601 [Hypoxylon sp. FL1284]|nr:hypothetical protein GGR52DRAFT_523601 [Hypoxylon sp. FL1284]
MYWYWLSVSFLIPTPSTSEGTLLTSSSGRAGRRVIGTTLLKAQEGFGLASIRLGHRIRVSRTCRERKAVSQLSLRLMDTLS